MAENEKFNATVESLFKGMDSFLSAKTVVGEAVTVNDTIILPFVDVSFGVGAGAFSGEKNNNAAGGLGGKMSTICANVCMVYSLDLHQLMIQANQNYRIFATVITIQTYTIKID